MLEVVVLSLTTLEEGLRTEAGVVVDNLEFNFECKP
jgi:hypothetical protein